MTCTACRRIITAGGHEIRRDAMRVTWQEYFRTPWCDCALCIDCFRGIVNRCPGCGFGRLGRLGPVEPERGPWMFFVDIGLVVGALLIMGWLAR